MKYEKFSNEVADKTALFDPLLLGVDVVVSRRLSKQTPPVIFLSLKMGQQFHPSQGRQVMLAY